MTEREPTTWVKVLIDRTVHSTLKGRADKEGRGITDYAGQVLTNAIEQSLSIGIVTRSGDRGDQCSPATAPLADYAGEANDLIIVGTTLNSLIPDLETFLMPKAREGCRITLLRVAPSLLQKNPEMLRQISFSFAEDASEALTAYKRTGEALEDFQARYSKTVSVLNLPTFPTFGMTFVDPFSEERKLRLRFYPYRDFSSCQIALHMRPTNRETKETFNQFLNHYHRLVVDATAASS